MGNGTVLFVVVESVPEDKLQVIIMQSRTGIVSKRIKMCQLLTWRQGQTNEETNLELAVELLRRGVVTTLEANLKVCQTRDKIGPVSSNSDRFEGRCRP